MRTIIDPVFLDKVRAERRHAASREERTAILDRAALAAGCSTATLYRALKESDERPRKKRTISEAAKARIQTIDEFARDVFQFALEHTFDHSRCDWKNAFEFLQEDNRIPKWVTLQMIYKGIERQELVNEWSPVAKRFEREHPMSMYQLDFSTSRHIKHIGDGRLRVTNAHATKKHDRRRLWFGVALDDASRVAYVEYFLAPGESAFEAQKLIVNTFSRKPARTDYPNDMVLQGIPKSIYVDRGSGWIDGATQVGLARMGVQCIIGANERDALGRALKKSNKKGRGKVEKFIQRVKTNFELPYSLRHPHGSEVSLAELNLSLLEWLESVNQEEHPTRRGEGRWQIYSPALLTASYAEETTLSLFTKRTTKKVRNRLINVAPNTYCIAPLWASDGDEVEIVSVHGFYYVMRGGIREQLKFQEGDNAVMPGESLRLQIETDDDVLQSFHINTRFEKELVKLTKNAYFTINAIPEPIWNEIADFFEADRTVRDIKALAYKTLEKIALLDPSAITPVDDLPSEVSAIQINPQGGLVYAV